jgi:hypothetical protein
MIDHIGLTVRNIGESKAFFGARWLLSITHC